MFICLFCDIVYCIIFPSFEYPSNIPLFLSFRTSNIVKFKQFLQYFSSVTSEIKTRILASLNHGFPPEFVLFL